MARDVSDNAISNGSQQGLTDLTPPAKFYSRVDQLHRLVGADEFIGGPSPV
jgi:hypothetical protein